MKVSKVFQGNITDVSFQVDKKMFQGAFEESFDWFQEGV